MERLKSTDSKETNQNLFKHHFQKKNTQHVNIFLNTLSGFLVKIVFRCELSWLKISDNTACKSACTNEIYIRIILQ